MSRVRLVAERPVLLGYQTVRAGGQRSEVWRKRRALMAYAYENGYLLGTVFIHEVGRGPTGALQALIEAAKNPQVVAVAVVTVRDLSDSTAVQGVIRSWLEREAEVRILVVEP